MRHARDQLRDLEPIFHRSPAGSGREVFERMTAEDFWEVGASGRVYPRPVVLDVLERRYADLPDDPWQVRDFAARPLGGDTWLVTYELDQAGRLTRRATSPGERAAVPRPSDRPWHAEMRGPAVSCWVSARALCAGRTRSADPAPPHGRSEWRACRCS